MNKQKIIAFINDSLKSKNYQIVVKNEHLSVPIRDLKIDSLLAFSIISDLEKTTNKTIPDELLMKIENLNDIVTFFSDSDPK